MILEDIKSATATSHQQLENSPLLQPLTSDALTSEHYFKILHTFYAFFYPLEQKINKNTVLKQYLPDFDSRRKAYSIVKDIRFLKPAYDMSAAELCSDLPEAASPAQAFGAMYVLEGSTLGGRYIAKSLQKHLNLDETNGASFFNGYGKDTGKRWKDFQQALQNFSEKYNNDQAVIQAANDTFEKFERWVNR